MTDNEKLNLLLSRLDVLLKKQDNFSREINDLRHEINSFKISINQPLTKNTDSPFVDVKTFEVIDPELQPAASTEQQEYKIRPPQPQFQAPVNKTKSDLEKFIGENLINKIGIVITVLGVGIGAKYSIDHQLISPLTRILLGYLMGAALLGFGIKLKKNFENYSAVLTSGSISIFYFITFAAYNFYELMPQSLTFLMMVLFTAFAVLTAIKYDKQVIAHIGLVGAYAVPFLLSEGSGKVVVLFSYMAIINIGILIIAITRYWKSLYYSSFILTWLIFGSWFYSKFQLQAHFELGLIFNTVFFFIFYTIFLVYKLVKSEKFNSSDIVLLLSNCVIFYGLGYAVLSRHEYGEELLGLFTLGNGLIHFIVAVLIRKRSFADRSLFHFITGLVLVFISIAIPVQLDGNWVTLLWVFEAALLFWIGRTKQLGLYEKLASVLMFISFFSLMMDWKTARFDLMYGEGYRFSPLLNINFLTGLLFIGAFVFIYLVHVNRDRISTLSKETTLIIDFAIPTVLLTVLYVTFRIEIALYWDQLYQDSHYSLSSGNPETAMEYWNDDYREYKSIWLINYSLFFLTILNFFNAAKIKSLNLEKVSMCFSILAVLIFILQGLLDLNMLRDSFLYQQNDIYHHGAVNFGIRYLSFVLLALLFISVYRGMKNLLETENRLKIAVDLLLHFAIVWVASNELLSWMEMIKSDQSTKLGISILWGVYALVLIALGIGKNRKHLRIGAIVLFGITLLKLFLYDISQLNTIAKTIVFVSLGILLLVISFLYNKYKHLIPENEA